MAGSEQHTAVAETTAPLSTSVPASVARLALPRARGLRGRAVRHALVVADLTGVITAFVLATAIVGPGDAQSIPLATEALLFSLTVPVWLILFKLHGLYDRDEERTDHSTVDELFGVLQVVTLGTWFFAIAALVTGLATPDLKRLAVFWLVAIALVTVGRAGARAFARRMPTYHQRVIVVGGGDIGQLVARKIQQHPEYGLELLGFVDADPKGQRSDINGVETLGALDQLASLVQLHDADRIVVAFSREPDAGTMEVVRALRDREVIIDVVPRLFDLVGPRASMHVIEGLPLVCVPPARLPRSSLLLKRGLDIAVSSVSLVACSPFFLYAAIRIKLDSPGPVFFRQTRLAMNMETFTALKFRTMKVDTDQEAHREYIRSIASADAAMENGSMYKLERDDAVTGFGRWLRKTSLDELPQLLNVLRGDMSIVGPRPCIPYEVENFKFHHHERFLVPQGITGMWQVAARASSTFGEALEMDVAYVRGWSLGLDLRLLFRTPFALLRQRRSTA